MAWVAQAGPAFSVMHLEDDPAAIAARLLPMLCDRLGVTVDRVTHAAAHRWRCARVTTPLGQTFLRDAGGSLYLGGDWCIGPRVIPGPHGATLATTTYAIIASAQLLALFTLWTPSGVVWWRAEGAAFWAISAVYAASWLLLIKASFDAGAEVQSGALGWMSLMAKIRPVFPDMPTDGLFRVIRQPIYVAFALTLWTVPVWTPDQLALAVCYTAYCLLAPRLKERRFAARYGDRFQRYRAAVPYAVPRLPQAKDRPHAQ